MRMWLVDTALLCNQHLLGEHVETHMFAGTANKGISLAGYVSRGLFDGRLLVARHAQLANEMIARGMKHNSPLPAVNEASLPDGDVDVVANLIELSRRCPKCKARQAFYLFDEVSSL